MREWKKKVQIRSDVIFFPYISGAKEKKVTEVYIWDLDKTYLDTRIDGVKSIFRVFFESHHKKKNIPGTNILLKALQKEKKSKEAIYFVTASPPQMEKKIRAKFKEDGIYPNGIFFKDNFKNIHPKNIWRIRQQVGYKLQALLQLKLRLPLGVKQILWGDDSEMDPIIYSLYSDICSHRLDSSYLEKTLKSFHVLSSQRDTIFQLQSEIEVCDPVEKVYINLEDDTDAEYYMKFGRRLVPNYNTFQITLDLFQDQRVSEKTVLDVAQDLTKNYSFTKEQIEWSLDDLVRRLILGEKSVKQILPSLIDAQLIQNDFKFSTQPRAIKSEKQGRVYELEGSFEPWVPEKIDYLHDYRF